MLTPTPAPRKSKDGPIIAKRRTGKYSNEEQLNTMVLLSNDVNESISKSTPHSNLRAKPSLKQVDIKTSQVSSENSTNKSLIDIFDSPPSISRDKNLKNTYGALEIVNGEVTHSYDQHRPKKKVVSKSVQLKLVEGQTSVKQSELFKNFALNQATRLNETLNVGTSQIKYLSFNAPSRTISYDSSGKTNVSVSESFQDFSEHTLTSISLPEAPLTHVSKRKIHPNLSNLTYSDDFEDYSVSGVSRLNHNESSVLENSEFSNSILDSQQKSNDKQSTSTIEYRDGQRIVKYSKDFESFSQGLKTEHSSLASDDNQTSKQGKDIHQKIKYGGGKKLVSYSHEFMNSLCSEISEDFENSNSWAVKVGKSSISKHTKNAAACDTDRSLEVVYSDEFENTPLFYSNKEILVEDIEDQSYTEDFESFTTKEQSLQRTRVNTSDEETSEYDSIISMDPVEIKENLLEKKSSQIALQTFIDEKIKLLKKGKTTGKKLPEKKIRKSRKEEQDIQKFVRKKCEILREKNEEGVLHELSGIVQNKNSPKYQLIGLNTLDCVESYGISPSVIEKLKLQNTIYNVAQAAAQDIHDPNNCVECSDKMAKFAAEKFIWHKKAIVSEKLVHEKTDMQILQLQNPMWLYAEALRGLPKVTDDRDIVYDQLIRPLYDSYAKNATINYQDSF